jgi:DNA-binding protein HU-beta
VTKVELVNAIAEKAELTKADAEKALKAVIDSITEALKDGDKVALVGFGTFSVSERAARTGKNPQTGEKIQINASRVPKFKAGKMLKDAVC